MTTEALSTPGSRHNGQTRHRAPVYLSHVGNVARETLRRNKHGVVLSSHATGLYCRMADGTVLLVHDEAFGLIPFGLGCPQPDRTGCDWKAVEPGTPVLVHSNGTGLAVGDVLFLCPTANAPETSFPWEATSPQGIRLRIGMEDAIRLLDDPARQGIAAAYLLRRDDFFAWRQPGIPLEDIWDRSVWTPLQRLMLFCLEGGDAAPDPLVAALLGLGQGLTPQADDILTGLLAAGFVLGQPFSSAPLLRLTSRVAPAVLRMMRGATTAQSIAFLHSAALGERFGMLDSLMAALYKDNSTERVRALAHVLDVGHSSGSGLVLGILFGVTLALTKNPHAPR